MITLHLLDRWSAASQQGSRRNAMVAATRLAERRSEWNEVQASLTDARRRRVVRSSVTRVAAGDR